MNDISQSLKIGWCVGLMMVCITGSFGIILLKKETDFGIALLLFVIFEWIGLLFSVILVPLAMKFLPKHIILDVAVVLTGTTFLFSTILGIYWIDNIIFENVTVHTLYLRRLKLCFATFFMVSLLLKPLIIFIFFRSSNKVAKKLNDPEKACSTTENESIATSSSPTSLYKSQSDNKTVEAKFEPTALIPNHNEHLPSFSDLSNARVLDYKGLCDTTNTTNATHSTSNISQNINLPIFHVEQILHDHKPTKANDKNNPSLLQGSLLPEFSNQKHHTEAVSGSLKKTGEFNFPLHPSPNRIPLPRLDHKPSFSDNEEDSAIHMLNISEPLQLPHIKQSKLSTSNLLHNISLQEWNKNSSRIIEQNGIINDPSGDYSFQIKTPDDENIHEDDLCLQTIYTDSSNVLFDELIKEIHDNEHHQIYTQQSLPDIKSSVRRSSSINPGSFPKILHSSISSSTLNLSSPKRKLSTKSLRTMHKKSQSQSQLQTQSLSQSQATMPMSRSKSQSPLKRIMNFRDSLDMDDKSSEFELDLNLANSLRNSPKKMSSFKSLNSSFQRKIESFSSHSKSDTVNVPDGASSLEIAASIKTDLPNPKMLPLAIVSNKFQDIVNKRVLSGTDRSTISNNSLPSGYYGQYDREKWNAYKKVNLSDDSLVESVNDRDFMLRIPTSPTPPIA